MGPEHDPVDYDIAASEQAAIRAIDMLTPGKAGTVPDTTTTDDDSED